MDNFPPVCSDGLLLLESKLVLGLRHGNLGRTLLPKGSKKLQSLLLPSALEKNKIGYLSQLLSRQTLSVKPT